MTLVRFSTYKCIKPITISVNIALKFTFSVYFDSFYIFIHYSTSQLPFLQPQFLNEVFDSPSKVGLWLWNFTGVDCMCNSLVMTGWVVTELSTAGGSIHISLVACVFAGCMSFLIWA